MQYTIPQPQDKETSGNTKAMMEDNKYKENSHFIN